jgi:hypothetical protein
MLRGEGAWKMKQAFLLLLLFFLICGACGVREKAKQDIRKTDFRNFDYRTCFDEEGKTTHVTDGKFSQEPQSAEFRSSVYFEVRDVVFGDLDGDGNDEAVVSTLCNGGGSGQFSDGLVYRLENNKPMQIGNLGEGDRAIDGIHEIRFANGQLEVDRYGGQSGACCPDYIETTAFRLKGKELIPTGKPEQRDYVSKDGNNAVRRVRFARGASSTEIKGSTNATAAYLIGARTGQTMKLKINGINLRVALESPDGADLPPLQLDQEWSAQLPADGDYRLRIEATGGPATFTIAFGIN